MAFIGILTCLSRRAALSLLSKKSMIMVYLDHPNKFEGSS